VSAFSKVLLAITGILILGVSVLVLFSKQPDTLSEYVPVESEWYFHSTGKTLLKFNEKLDSLPKNFQFALTELTNSQIDYLVEQKINEFGLFYYKNNYFLLAPAQPASFTFAQNNKLNYLHNNSVILMSKTNFDFNLQQIQNNTFKKQRKIWDFSSFQFYLNKGPLIFAKLINTSKFTAETLYGTIKQNQVCLSSKTKTKLLTTNPQLLNLVNLQQTFYINGLIAENLGFQVSPNYPNDLLWLFLGNISGPIELLQTQNKNFILGFDAQNNSLAKIKQILSFHYPNSQQKLLPDQTSAIHLIADPEKFYLQNEVILDKNKNKLLYLVNLDKKTFVTNNQDLVQHIQSQPLDNQPKILFSFDNIQFVFQTNICGKVSVCID